MSHPKSYDGMKLHFSLEDLERHEKAARSMSRMDLTDKMKLINQSHHAIRLEEVIESVIFTLDEAMTLLAWYKTETGNDHNGKTNCCQEDGERLLARLKSLVPAE